MTTDSNTDSTAGNEHPAHPRSVFQKWRKVSINNKLLVIFAGVTTIATVLYSGFAGWQLYEIHTGAQDTHSLAEAAKRQADKTETISDSIASAVTALQAQAKAAQDGAGAIQRQTIQAQRPWIKFTMGDPKVSPTVSWYVQVGSPLTAPVMFTNIGKTPAINVDVRVGIDLVPRGKDPKLPVAYRNPRAKPPKHFVRTAIRELRTGTIFPDGNVHDMVDRLELRNGQPIKKVVTPDEAKAVNEGNAYLVIFGEAGYLDGFGIKRWTRFCRDGFANGEDANSGKCAQYNAVDNK